MDHQDAMDITEDQRQRLREAAATLDGIDNEAYRGDGRDPLEPIIGLGPADAPVALFGRDPGREEVRHGLPFIGAGGQLLRKGLYRHCHGVELPDFQASIQVGYRYFWANTVPYKPAGNKAWSMRVKRAIQPIIAEILVHGWRGEHVITLGREAFMWFGINQSKAVRDALTAFWGRADRFEASHETELADGSGASRALILHPLPHPSPLNATWYKHIPRLLSQRLAALERAA
jgi:uracil-DNA glycosylase family 4